MFCPYIEEPCYESRDCKDCWCYEEDNKMEYYALIYEENSDSRCGSDVSLFFSSDLARAQMEKKYKKLMELLKFDTSRNEEDYHSECNDMSASIVMGLDSFSWRIERLSVEGEPVKFSGVDVAIEVSGGLVRNVYANGPVSVEVYDLDSSDFADEEELTQTDVRIRELEEAISEPGWERVW